MYNNSTNPQTNRFITKILLTTAQRAVQTVASTIDGQCSL